MKGDVFVQNLEPGLIQRAGLNRVALRKDYPVRHLLDSGDGEGGPDDGVEGL